MISPTALPSSPAEEAPTLQPGDSPRTLIVNDLERTYLIHIPPGLDGIKPVPVVFAFHGNSNTPSEMQRVTEFNSIADAGHFIVIYPEGTGGWNVGKGCCDYAGQNNIDDIAFVRQILSDLTTIASVDTKRVYATGVSGGAAFVFRLACEMSDVFAAVAPAAGFHLFSPCQPQQPVSLIEVHGLADTLVPYSGGGEFDAPSVEQTITEWARLDGCAKPAQIEKQNTITHTIYASCDADAAVELYALEAGGHIWPSKYIWPASQVIWDFFAAHPKP
jgi:polyhydroxybutyrate depolymerase